MLACFCLYIGGQRCNDRSAHFKIPISFCFHIFVRNITLNSFELSVLSPPVHHVHEHEFQHHVDARYQKKLFLTFKAEQVSVWNLKGEVVTTYIVHFMVHASSILFLDLPLPWYIVTCRFEDHPLMCTDWHSSNIYINSKQDLIISICEQYGAPDNVGQSFVFGI